MMQPGMMDPAMAGMMDPAMAGNEQEDTIYGGFDDNVSTMCPCTTVCD